MTFQYEEVELRADSELESDADMSRSSSKRRTAIFVVSLLMLGLVAYTAASHQNGTSLRNGDVQNAQILAEDESSTVYWVKHVFKDKSDAPEYWKKGKESNGTLAAEQDAAAGIHTSFMIPIAKDGPFYGIWEVKAGHGKDYLADYLSQDKTICGKFASYFHNTISEIPAALAGPWPYTFFKGKGSKSRRLDEDKKDEDKKDRPNFYLVKHTFKKDGDSEDWWKGMAKFAEDKEAWAASVKHAKDKGFVNTVFAPLDKDGPIHCLWQAAAGKTKEDLADFLDNTKFSDDFAGTSALNNEITLVPNSLDGGNPGPY